MVHPQRVGLGQEAEAAHEGQRRPLRLIPHGVVEEEWRGDVETAREHDDLASARSLLAVAHAEHESPAPAQCNRKVQKASRPVPVPPHVVLLVRGTALGLHGGKVPALTKRVRQQAEEPPPLSVARGAVPQALQGLDHRPPARAVRLAEGLREGHETRRSTPHRLFGVHARYEHANLVAPAAHAVPVRFKQERLPRAWLEAPIRQTAEGPQGGITAVFRVRRLRRPPQLVREGPRGVLADVRRQLLTSGRQEHHRRALPPDPVPAHLRAVQVEVFEALGGLGLEKSHEDQKQRRAKDHRDLGEARGGILCQGHRRHHERRERHC
mmetsp:Transcript_49143/g.137607  ORF Transcript_49143/g.137607 Transcript_49143/m.137607 type:complete len:324 (+) Transcript_49143:342-1313(+)